MIDLSGLGPEQIKVLEAVAKVPGGAAFKDIPIEMNEKTLYRIAKGLEDDGYLDKKGSRGGIYVVPATVREGLNIYKLSRDTKRPRQRGQTSGGL